MTRQREPAALLRPAVRKDAGRLAELWVGAFPDSRTAAQRRQQLLDNVPYGGIDDAWLIERDGQLVAACRLHPMRQFLAGAELPMMGVAGVAVASTARRRGLGAALCRDALRIAHERGDVVSVLYPFRPDFYAALGWGYVGELWSYRVATRALAPVDDDGARRVRRAEPGDRAAIEASYLRLAQRSHGPIRRSAGAWDQHLKDPAETVLSRDPDSGHVTGYVIARYGREPVHADRTLRIQELIAEDEGAARALWGWVAAQRDQRAVVTYDARPDEGFELRLSDPRPPRFADRRSRRLWTPTARVLRGPMLRVVSVGAALEARRWGALPGGGARIRLEVTDDELPSNLGPWSVEVEAGAARVVEGPCDGADASLTCDPSVFARIWAGEIRASDAGRLGLAAVDDPEALMDAAFAVRSGFWLADSF